MIPILFDSSWLKIYSYPLFIGLAWGTGFSYFIFLLEKFQLDQRGMKVLFILNFFVAWIGAKIFFLIYSSGEYFEKLASSSSFWLGGGFVFYGGLIFSILFSLFYCLILKRCSANSLIAFLPALTLGHGIGRIGCFFSGCCFGRPLDSSYFWSIKIHHVYRHPAQLYEALGLFLLTFWLYKMLSRDKKKTLGLVLFYLLGYSILRFFIEFYRGDKIRGIHGSLSTSQILSLTIICICLMGGTLYLRLKNGRLRDSSMKI